MKEIIVFQFEPLDPEIAEMFREEFRESDIMETNSFLGTEILAVILLGGEAIKKTLKFFSKYSARLGKTSIAINGDGIELKGFSAEEITELVESGNLEKLKDLISAKKSKNGGK